MTPLFSVTVTVPALKALRHVDKTQLLRITAAIELLRHNPFPPKSRRLRGRDGHRIRVGDYRVLYQVRREEILIVIVAIGHRREIYR